MRPENPKEYVLASDKFPAGLKQAKGSYRFGTDALLLAAFAWRLMSGKKPKKLKIADLGCGCGASLLAFALRNPSGHYLGLDIAKEHISCAQQNAASLNIPNSCFICEDLQNISRSKELRSWLRHCDCVMANPPWRPANETTRPKSDIRSSALWEDKDTLAIFLYAARELLMHHGFFCAILPPVKLSAFCASIRQFDLGLEYILPVANLPGENAIRVLFCCRKSCAGHGYIASPLTLREKNDAKTVWSRQALDFCPWLVTGKSREVAHKAKKDKDYA